jgi:hypothetical protein
MSKTRCAIVVLGLAAALSETWHNGSIDGQT